MRVETAHIQCTFYSLSGNFLPLPRTSYKYMIFIDVGTLWSLDLIPIQYNRDESNTFVRAL